MAEADTLIAAFGADGALTELHASMTPGLRERIRLPELEFAAAHLAEQFGPARGIMEEKVHTEGDLLWYSALVVHATADDQPGTKSLLTPVVYQFALTADRRFARLLVREHWFWSAVQHPADYYVPVNRFRVPGRGDWLVRHGGRSRATNKHHGSRQQRFAFDLIIKRDNRSRPAGSAKRNASYYCHGEPILAPSSGVVVLQKDGIAENKIGGKGKGGGNGVRIDHGFGEWSSLWHMIPGSVRVDVGDHVEAGQVLGLVGNSGASTGPHIHIDVYHPDGEFSLPVEFVDAYVNGRWRDRVMPVRGETIRGQSDTSKARTARGPVVFAAG